MPQYGWQRDTTSAPASGMAEPQQAFPPWLLKNSEKASEKLG